MSADLANDENLIKEAQRIGQHKTKKEAVRAALREYISLKRRQALLDMAGTISFDPTYDYKVERKRR